MGLVSPDKMKYIYLLSSYDEHGSEDVHATLDREDVVPLMYRLFEKWKLLSLKWNDEGHTYGTGEPWTKNLPDKKYIEETITALQLRLEQPDNSFDRDGINLNNGWGGMQLHVIPIESGDAI